MGGDILSREEVFQKVASLVSKHFEVDEAGITNATDIVKDLNADSISVMEFVLELEDEFDLEISDEDAENITTVGQVVDYITGLEK
jgi:acyl carrier protein